MFYLHYNIYNDRHETVFSCLSKNTPAAKIFNSIASVNFKHSIVVTRTAKRLAWLIVIMINIYFVYFALLRAMTRSRSWQLDYIVACMFQMFVEIFLYETGECIWIHYVIPKLVHEEVSFTMNTVREAINLAFSDDDKRPVLNTPSFFFPSVKLAHRFPNLFESSIVLSFLSYFPPQDLDLSYSSEPVKATLKHNKVGVTGGFYASVNNNMISKLALFFRRFSLSMLVLSMLQRIGTVPIRAQQLIIHTLQPIFLSLVIVAYYFCIEYPLVGIIPLFFIVYEVLNYFCRVRNRLVTTVPAINDAEKIKNMTSIVPPIGLSAHESASDEEKSNNKRLSSSVGNCNENCEEMSDSCKPDRKVLRNVEKAMSIMSVKNFNDSSSDDSDSNIGKGDNFENVMEKMKFHLHEKLKKADKDIKDFMVQTGYKKKEDLDFDWEENSDDYKCFYQEDIKPYVDSKGTYMSVSQITSQRNTAMLNDYAMFKRNEALARSSVKKKSNYMRDWDNFRLYESDAVIPFVDHCGVKRNSKDIEEARQTKDYTPETNNLSLKNKKKLFRLKKKKQLIEHRLLVFEEEIEDDDLDVISVVSE